MTPGHRKIISRSSKAGERVGIDSGVAEILSTISRQLVEISSLKKVVSVIFTDLLILYKKTISVGKLPPDIAKPTQTASSDSMTPMSGQLTGVSTLQWSLNV